MAKSSEEVEEEEICGKKRWKKKRKIRLDRRRMKQVERQRLSRDMCGLILSTESILPDSP